MLGLRACTSRSPTSWTAWCYLEYGLAALLLLVGIKMVVVDRWHVPTALSLTVIATILAVPVVVSPRATRSLALSEEASL
jgi:tellurite resistance protein TerC